MLSYVRMRKTIFAGHASL